MFLCVCVCVWLHCAIVNDGQRKWCVFDAEIVIDDCRERVCSALQKVNKKKIYSFFLEILKVFSVM